MRLGLSFIMALICLVTASGGGHARDKAVLNKLLAGTNCLDSAKRRIMTSSGAAVLSIETGSRLRYRYQRIRTRPFQENAGKAPEIVTAEVALHAVDWSNKLEIRKIGSCTVVELACRERDCIAFTAESSERSYRFSRGILDIYFTSPRKAAAFAEEITALIRKK